MAHPAQMPDAPSTASAGYIMLLLAVLRSISSVLLHGIAPYSPEDALSVPSLPSPHRCLVKEMYGALRTLHNCPSLEAPCKKELPKKKKKGSNVQREEITIMYGVY